MRGMTKVMRKVIREVMREPFSAESVARSNTGLWFEVMRAHFFQYARSFAKLCAELCAELCASSLGQKRTCAAVQAVILRHVSSLPGISHVDSHAQFFWFPLISFDFERCPSTSSDLDFLRFVLIPSISFDFLWLTLISFDFSLISFDFLWFRLVSFDFFRIHVISFDFLISLDFLRFPFDFFRFFLIAFDFF